MKHDNVKVTQSRVEIRYTVQKEGARPNGLHYDPICKCSRTKDLQTLKSYNWVCFSVNNC